MPTEIQDSVGMKFVLKKKKIVLKTKINLHSVNQKKPQKEKKKWTKVPVQLKKKKIHIKKFETQNLRRGNAALILVEDIDKQGGRQNVNEKV